MVSGRVLEFRPESMAKRRCCAMAFNSKTETTHQCRRTAETNVSIRGPDGSMISKDVCDDHFRMATWDREQGGQWGLRIRIFEKKKGFEKSDFCGFVGEPPSTDKYLRKTKKSIVVGEKFGEGLAAKVMGLHHICPSPDGDSLFYLIHWKAPHDDPIPAKQEQLPCQMIADEGQVIPDSECSLRLPDVSQEALDEILGNQRKRR